MAESGYRSFYGVDWPPVPDGRGNLVPVTKEFAGMVIGKKWRFYKKELGIEFKDPWEPLIESAKSLIPDKYFKVPTWTEEHFHDWVMAEKGAITWGCASCGKMTLKSEPVFTPGGQTTVGQLKVGDKVIAATGRPAEVVGIYEQVDRPLYSVKFADGTETICGDEHLWTVRYWGRARWEGPHRSRKARYGYLTRTLSTKRLASWSDVRRKRTAVPLTEPVEFAPRDVPVDPYVLGCLLGDGSLCDNVMLSSGEGDGGLREEFRRRLAAEFPGYELKKASDAAYYVAAGSGRGRNLVKAAIGRLGLLGHRSHEKFVPDVYKVNSSDVRFDLLAGLFDTDGTVGRNGAISYCTTSPALAEDVRWMLQSVGASVTVSEKHAKYTVGGEAKSGRAAYTLRVHGLKADVARRLFKLERKRRRIRPRRGEGYKAVVGVELVRDRSEYPRDTRCIRLAERDDSGNEVNGLFPVGNFTVTHNSNDYGLLMLLDWVTDPFDTAIRLGSTDKQSLKSRSWNAVITYFTALKHNQRGLLVPGKLSKSGYAILNDGDDSAESVGEKAGIVGVAVNDAEDSGKLQGAHAKFVRLVIDELATITHHGNIQKAMQNLRIGSLDFKFYALANPASWEDPSCQYCIPQGGVSSVNVDTGYWISTRGYIVRHHDGLKSPTLKSPEAAKEFPFLIKQEDIDQNLSECDGNADAPLFWQMTRGFPVPGNTGVPTVLDVRVANDQHVTDRAVFASAPVAAAAGIDPAWSEGGDGAVYQRVLVRNLDGRPILDFTDGMHRLQIRATSDRPVAKQLLDQVHALMSDPGGYCAPLAATAVDASANQGLADDLDIFIGRGAAHCLHVSNGVRASENPIRFGQGDICRDRYRDRGTEAWCVLAEFCKAGMVRGLPAEALRGLVQRRFAVRKGTTQQVTPLMLESKDDFRARFRKSPDETDACALAALAVKEVLGLLPFGWLTSAKAPLVGDASPTPVAPLPPAPEAGQYGCEWDVGDSYDPEGGLYV